MRSRIIAVVIWASLMLGGVAFAGRDKKDKKDNAPIPATSRKMKHEKPRSDKHHHRSLFHHHQNEKTRE